MNRTFIYLAGLCISLLFVTSCGSTSSKYAPDAEGFAKIQGSPSKPCVCKKEEYYYFCMKNNTN
jgi:hypothetical protein